MRHVREVTMIRGRVAKWTPVGLEGIASGIEPDGKRYFWSDDPIFETMSQDEDELGLADRHGNRQWELENGKLAHKKDSLTVEQKGREVSLRFKKEYPQDRFNEIMSDAEEARMDGAAADDPAFVALKTMQNRKRAIVEEVDAL